MPLPTTHRPPAIHAGFALLKVLRFIPALGAALCVLGSEPVRGQEVDGLGNVGTIRESKKQELARFTDALRMEWERSRRARDSAAAVMGIPLIRCLTDGTPLSLDRIRNGVPIYLVPANAVAAAAIRTDVARSRFNLDGAGIAIAMWNFLGTYTDHPELRGRAQQMDGAPPDTGVDHATHVAGTMIAAGVDPLARGMAPAGELRCYDYLGGDTFRMGREVQDYDLRLSNHTYGHAAGWVRGRWYGDPRIHQTIDFKFGCYDDRSHDWDSLAVLAPHYLIVKAGSNYRGEGGSTQPPPPGTPENNGGALGYDCLATYAVAKNILTVGASDAFHGDSVASFSAWGPSDDGRIKPDILGHGSAVYSSSHTAPVNKPDGYSSASGCSMAAASVTGSIALLLQHQRRLDSAIQLRAATVKALVLHTASDVESTGPDYRSGWGLMNTERAAELLSSEHACGEHVFNTLYLDGGVPDTGFTVRSTGAPLKVTICWNDPPALPLPLDSSVLNNTAPRLVHDIDLRVRDSAGVHYPWVLGGLANPSAPASTGDNTLDNVEQILIAAPVAGKRYTIEVSHKGVLRSRQHFSMIVTGNCRLNADASGPAVLCSRDSARLHAAPSCDDPPFTFEWFPKDSTLDDPFAQDPLVTIANTDTLDALRFYIVEIRDGHGCRIRDTIQVLLRGAMRARIDGDTVICSGDPLTLAASIAGGTSPYRYEWMPTQLMSDPASPAPTAFPLMDAVIRLRVTDANGCVIEAPPLRVTVRPRPPRPVITAIDDTLECSTATYYQWNRNGADIPGATAQRFVAMQSGAYTVRITDTNGCSSTSDTLHFLVSGAAVVEIDTLSGEPGKRMRIPMRLRTSTRLDDAGAAGFAATIRFNKDVLFPQGSTPIGIVTGNDRVIDVRGRRDPGTSILGELDLLPMLGPVDRTPIHIVAFQWDSARVRTTVVDGEFRLDICREGGDRLFDGGDSIALGPNHPNPFRTRTAIEYTLIEEGRTELAVLDLLGRIVATIVSSVQSPGRHTADFDAARLPAGAYILRLSTPTQHRMRAVLVAH